jgi:hypothetical protein
MMFEEALALALYAYQQGYERGHDATVEGAYGDIEETATDWLKEAIECGAIEDFVPLPESYPHWHCMTDAEKDEAIRLAI